MPQPNRRSLVLLLACWTVAVIVVGAALGVAADSRKTTLASSSVSAPGATHSTSTSMLSLAELAQRASNEGIRAEEIEIHGWRLEVEGYDADNREVELVLDRRSGKVLSRRFDD